MTMHPCDLILPIPPLPLGFVTFSAVYRARFTIPIQTYPAFHIGLDDQKVPEDSPLHPRSCDRAVLLS